MAGELGVAYLSLAVSSGGVERDIRKSLGNVESDAGRAGKKSGSAFAGGFKGVLGILGGLAVLGKTADFLRDANAEARESQKVNALTASIIKSTGGAAKVTAGQVGDLATKLSNATGVDDELIQSSANLLLTFKNVRNELGKGNQVFDRATAAAQDLSAAGFGDASGAAKMLGKALNDPIKGMSAMGRAGVTFTEAQQKQVKALVKSGDLLGAQKIILGEVESQVGGAAAASATAAEKLSTKWANFKELVGEKVVVPLADAIAPQIGRVIDAISPLVESVGPRVEAFIGRLSNFFGDLGKRMGPPTGLMGTLAAAMGPLIAAGSQVLSAVGPMGLLFQSLQPLLPMLVQGFTSLAQQGLAIIVPLLTQMAPLFTQVSGVLVQAGTQIAAALLPVLMQLAQAVMPVLAQVIAAAAPVVTQLVQALLPVVPIVANLVSSLLPPLADAISALLPALVPVIEAALSIVQALIPFVSVAAELLGTVLPPLAAAIAALLPPLVSVVSWLAGQVAEALSRFAGMITDAVGPVRDFAKVVGEKIAEVLNWFAGLPAKLTGPLSDLPGKLLNIGKDMIQGLINGAKNMIGSAVAAIADVAGSIIDGAKRALGIASPSKVFKKIGKNVVQGFALGISMESGIATRAITELTDLITKTAEKAKGKKAKKAAKTAAGKATGIIAASQVETLSLWALGEEKATDRLLSALTTRGTWVKSASSAIKKSTLADVQAARGVVADRLSAARSTLESMKDAMKSLREQVASSVTGELDLAGAMSGGGWQKSTDAAGNTHYTSGTGGGMAGIRSHVSGLLGKARTFAGKIKDLIKAGFPASIVQYIAGMGVEGGASAAAMILSASKTDQSGLIGDWAALDAVSGSVGSMISEQMYGAGISAQEGLIAGLMADDAKLAKAAEALAAKLTAAVKKALKIKSPSRLWRDEVGLMLAKGVAEGLGAGRATVAASARALLSPAIAGSPNWENYPGGAGGGITYAPTYNNPIAEPTEIVRNRDLQLLAAMGGI